MTLTTRVRITTPISPEGVWAKCESLLGAPADVDYTVRPIDDPTGWGHGWVLAQNQLNQGLPAWLQMYSATARARHIDADEFDVDDYGPHATVQVSFDTGGDSEREALHRRLTAELGTWLDEQGAQWFAQDDYSGEWHQRTPCPIG